MERVEKPLRSMEGSLKGWYRFVRSEVHVLAQHPALLFQLAANQPDSTEPARAARQRWSSGRLRDPWLRWINKPKTLSPRVMTLVGHTGAIETVAASSDGKRIASGGEDGIVRVWDARSGQEVFQLAGHGGSIRALAMDAPTRSIVSGSDDGTIRVWDSDSGAERLTLATGQDYTDALVISPLNSTLLSASGGTVRLWDLRTGREAGSFEGYGPLVVSPDGRRFAHSVPSQGFSVRDLQSGAQLYSVGGTTAIAFSPRGGRLASSHYELVMVHDGETGKELTRFVAFTHSTPALLITHDDRYLITGHKHGEIKVWDLATFEELHYAEGAGGSVRALVPLDGRRFVSLGSSGRGVSIWDADSGSVLQTTSGHTERVTAVALIPGTSQLVTASWDGTLVIWDTEHGTESEQCVGGGQVYRLLIAPDCTRVVVGSDGISAWNAVDGRRLWSEPEGTLKALSSDGRRVFVTVGYGDSRRIKVWELESRRELLSIEHPHGWDTIVTKDGSRIVSATSDFVQQDLRVWDAHTGRKIHQLSAESPLRFSVGERAVISRRSWLVLEAWDQRTGEMRRQVHVQRSYKKVRLTADATRAIGQIRPGVFDVMDASTGEVLFVLDAREPGESIVNEWEFCVNGNASRLVVCRTKSIDVWDCRTGQFMRGTSLEFTVDLVGGREPLLIADARLAVLCVDRVVGKEWCVVDCDTGRKVIDLKNLSADALALAADGTHLAVAAKGSLVLLDTRNRALVAQCDSVCDVAPAALTVATGGRFVAVNLKEDALIVWNTATGHLDRLPGSGPAVTSPDGKWLAFRGGGDRGNCIEVWDLDAGHRTRSLECDGKVLSMAFSADSGELMVSYTEAQEVCFELESGRETSLRPDEVPGIAESDRDADDLEIVAIGDRIIGVRDRPSGCLLARFPCPEKILGWHGERMEPTIFHAVGGDLVAVGGQEFGNVYILRLERNESATPRHA